LKIHASIKAFLISDYAMTNIFFFEPLFLMGSVPLLLKYMFDGFSKQIGINR